MLAVLFSTLDAHLVSDRGKDCQSVSTRGLFPAGEGAGYAGGIVSAAVDGLLVGRAVAADVLGRSMIGQKDAVKELA